MAYRRRRSYRRGPSQAQLSRRWIRDATSVNTVTNSQIMVVDLLWEARQPPAEPTVLEDPARAAAETGYSGLLDVTGATIERLHFGFAYHHEPTDNTGNFFAHNGFYIGIMAGEAGTQGSGREYISDRTTNVNIDPSAWPACNQVDWMYYRRWYHGDLSSPNLIGATLLQAGGGGTVDVKSRRRLKELGDSVFLVFSPSLSGSDSCQVNLSWSMLVRTR